MEFDCNSRDDWKMDREDLITVRELCKILKVSKSWVRRTATPAETVSWRKKCGLV